MTAHLCRTIPAYGLLTAQQAWHVRWVWWRGEHAKSKQYDVVIVDTAGRLGIDQELMQQAADIRDAVQPDETLLVQSGKPVGIVRTHKDAPRVLIANSNLVPHWATQAKFDELAAKGLMMFGQMTAGSWIYIGTQGILQGTYETYAECARQHFGATLKHTLNVTGGCGGMGGAQPLAITMNEGTCLIADVCRERLEKRVRDRYLDEMFGGSVGESGDGLDAAIDRALALKAQGQAISVGWVGNIVDLFPPKD